jgi:hypothetical protein
MTTQLDESQSQLGEPSSHDQGWIIHSVPVAEPEGGSWQRSIQRFNQVAPVFWWQADPICEVCRQWCCSLRWLPNEGRKGGCCIHCQMLIKCLSWSFLSMPMLLSFAPGLLCRKGRNVVVLWQCKCVLMCLSQCVHWLTDAPDNHCVWLWMYLIHVVDS